MKHVLQGAESTTEDAYYKVIVRLKNEMHMSQLKIDAITATVSVARKSIAMTDLLS